MLSPGLIYWIYTPLLIFNVASLRLLFMRSSEYMLQDSHASLMLTNAGPLHIAFKVITRYKESYLITLPRKEHEKFLEVGEELSTTALHRYLINAR